MCIASASRRKFKIIDVGSAVLGHDVHFSYVQTRGYRAPEVMLGLPWGEKVDQWGVGCILAELMLGQQLFHGPSVEHVLAAQQAVLGAIPEAMVRWRQPPWLPRYPRPPRRVYIDRPCPLLCAVCNRSAPQQHATCTSRHQATCTPSILPATPRAPTGCCPSRRTSRHSLILMMMISSTSSRLCSCSIRSAG